jgi:hypothetical protein
VEVKNEKKKKLPSAFAARTEKKLRNEKETG